MVLFSLRHQLQIWVNSKTNHAFQLSHFGQLGYWIPKRIINIVEYVFFNPKIHHSFKGWSCPRVPTLKKSFSCLHQIGFYKLRLTVIFHKMLKKRFDSLHMWCCNSNTVFVNVSWGVFNKPIFALHQAFTLLAKLWRLKKGASMLDVICKMNCSQVLSSKPLSSLKSTPGVDVTSIVHFTKKDIIVL